MIEPPGRLASSAGLDVREGTALQAGSRLAINPNSLRCIGDIQSVDSDHLASLKTLPLSGDLPQEALFSVHFSLLAILC